MIFTDVSLNKISILFCSNQLLTFVSSCIMNLILGEQFPLFGPHLYIATGWKHWPDYKLFKLSLRSPIMFRLAVKIELVFDEYKYI